MARDRTTRRSDGRAPQVRGFFSKHFLADSSLCRSRPSISASASTATDPSFVRALVRPRHARPRRTSSASADRTRSISSGTPSAHADEQDMTMCAIRRNTPVKVCAEGPTAH